MGALHFGQVFSEIIWTVWYAFKNPARAEVCALRVGVKIAEFVIQGHVPQV